MDRHPGVGLESKPHAAPFDLQDRDLKNHLEILSPSDHHALAILPR